MGQSASQIEEQAQAKAAEDQKQAQDALNALSTIAKLKKDAFFEMIKSKGDDDEVKIDKVIIKEGDMKCSVTKNSDDLKKGINDIVGSFCKGDFAGAISGIVNTGLDMVMGNYTANQSEHQLYCILVQGEVLSRLDVYLYSYAYTSKSMISVTENVVVYAYAVSSIDVQSLDRSTLMSIISTQYQAIDQQEKLLEEIMKIYNIQKEKLTLQKKLKF